MSPNLRSYHALAAIGLCCAASSGAMADTASPDWGQILRQDAQAIHDAIADSHPGALDAENPDFRRQLEDGLSLALQRAETATDEGGYWWALRAFTARFDDAHVFLNPKTARTSNPRWPGFLTAYHGDDMVVAHSESPDLPPVGAKLIACDGTPAEALAAERVGQFTGRWFLRSQRVRQGGTLFINDSNPWLSDLSECRFEVEDQVRDYALTWSAGGDALKAALEAVSRTVTPTAGLTELNDGGVWISTPGFNGDPQSADYAALQGILDAMKGRQDRLRQAPYVVLDLRGNRGGSSIWGRRMAEALWGEDWMAANRPGSSKSVEWRASAANVAYLGEILDYFRANNVGADVQEAIAKIRDGITDAHARNALFWVETFDTEDSETTATPATPTVNGTVFILTDHGCVSACLDAVDLWKAAGGVQVGQETSADTVYMEIRKIDLASNRVSLSIPIKVYRGRPRGHNQPHTPVHDIPLGQLDEGALKARIAALVQP